MPIIKLDPYLPFTPGTFSSESQAFIKNSMVNNDVLIIRTGPLHNNFSVKEEKHSFAGNLANPSDKIDKVQS